MMGEEALCRKQDRPNALQRIGLCLPAPFGFGCSEEPWGGLRGGLTSLYLIVVWGIQYRQGTG
jgi:hypothetical protein